MLVARKIAYNIVVSSVAKFLSTILALISIGLITRYLGKDGFGNYATVLAFLAFFTAIADLGLNTVSTREISRQGAKEEEIISNIFSLRIITSLLILFLAPLIIWVFPYSVEVKEAIMIVAASFLFSSSYQIFNGVFQKHLAMDKVAVAELVGKIFQVAIIFLVIELKLGFLWIVSALFFYMLISFILVYILSKKYIKIKFKIDLNYWKKFIQESYPLGIAALISFIYFKVDTIMLSVIKSSTEVGIYSAAYKIIENITFFPAMIIGLIFPIMSHNIFSNKKHFQLISNKTYKVFWLLVIPLVIGTLFLAPAIINLIGGSGFSQSVIILKILIFALALIFFSNFSNAILVAANQQKKLMMIMLIAAIFNVGANLIFIPLYSYFAASIISVITELLVVVGTFIAIYKKINYFPKIENIGGILGAGIVMILFFLTFNKLNFIVAGGLSVLIYSLALWIFKAIKTEEITSLISKKDIKEYE